MHKFIIIDDVASQSDANNFINLIDRMTQRNLGRQRNKKDLQTIENLPTISNTFWNKVKHHLYDNGLDIVRRDGRLYKLIGFADYVTLSKHTQPIGIHKDADGRTKYNGYRDPNIVCLYKMALYLNTFCHNPNCTQGGTTLYDDNKSNGVTVSPKVGRALIFDMRDWHSGASIPRGATKYLIGFRLLYKLVN